MQEGGREDVPVELIRHCLLPHVAQTRENGRPALRHELPQKHEEDVKVPGEAVPVAVR